MSNPRAQAVLYESEAALRLVDQELHNLHELSREEHRLGSTGLADLPGILERANAQILGVLSRLRESRAALQRSTVENLQVTHEKLREVTSATEDAAIDIMDACDRATGLVDELDAIDAQPEPDRPKAAALRGTLRDELFLMMGALQFQDITSQQLTHASSVLMEMEQRLIEVSKLFDLSSATEAMAPRRSVAQEAFDPNATTRDAEGRQALADEIFTTSKAPVV
jgi:chemotaxis regulatin CheY-phosphate phosphatase CheZ